MVINCALAAASMVLSLIGAPVPATSHSPGATTHATPAARMLAVADSFSPPPKAKKRRSTLRSVPPGGQPSVDSGDSAADEAPAPPPRRQSPPPTTRRRAAPPDQEQQQQDDRAADDDEEEDRPRVRRHAARQKAEDEDEDESEDGAEGQDDEPFASLPVILPRLVVFGAGVSAVGRNFQFNTVTLLREGTLRSGGTLSLETYPLIHRPRGWFKQFGIGFSYSVEVGAAAKQQANGSSSSFPVQQQRWSIDLRYVVPIGARIVVIPALGYGASTFYLQRPTPVPPSTCTGAMVSQTDPTVLPCLANVQTGTLIADLHLRIAVTSGIGVALTGGYLAGLSVGKGVGQIGSEAATTSFAGFHGAIAASFMINNWLAVQAAIPIVSYSYKFSGGTATYASASETYYGATIGAILFTQ